MHLCERHQIQTIKANSAQFSAFYTVSCWQVSNKETITTYLELPLSAGCHPQHRLSTS